jgi:hypothetical protein
LGIVVSEGRLVSELDEDVDGSGRIEGSGRGRGRRPPWDELAELEAGADDAGAAAVDAGCDGPSE